MNRKALLRTGGWILRLILDWLLILAGVLGALGCLCSAFGLPTPRGLLPLTGLLALSLCLTLGLKRGRLWALVHLALLLLAAFLLRKPLWESLQHLWGVLAVYYARGYSQVRSWIPQIMISKAAAAPAILALGLGMTYVAGLSVRRWRRTLPGALALLVGIAPCFVLTDTPPDLLPLLAAAFSTLTQAFSQTVRRRAAGEEGRSLALGAVLAALLLAVPMLIWPRETYKTPITWEELADKLELWTLQREIWGNEGAGLSGSPDRVDLSTLPPLPSRGVVTLRVTSDLTGKLYLRATSYTDFDGVAWEQGTREDWEEEVVYPYLGQEEGHQLRIRTVRREEAFFTAYQPTQLPPGGSLRGDYSYDNDDSATEYSQRFLPETQAVAPDPLYHQWVRSIDLALPETTREGVLAWWDQQEEHRVKYADQLDLAQAAARAVSRCATYSRDPLQMPDEAEDFPTWFLTEAQEGYCVHFASSCTALLRALGIPARYTSGYVCDAVAGQESEVTSLQAHAWVEIFYRGRWVMIEPTPGDATEFTGRVDPLPGLAETETTSPADTEPTLPAASTEAGERPGFTEPTAPEPSETDHPHGGGEGTGPAGTRKTPGNLTWLWILLGFLGALGLILGRRLLVLRLRARRLALAPVNGRARLCYRAALAMTRHTGQDLPPAAERLANKASFSQHQLTPQELEVLQQALAQQTALLNSQPWWKRLYYKYVLCVI